MRSSKPAPQAMTMWALSDMAVCIFSVNFIISSHYFLHTDKLPASSILDMSLACTHTAHHSDRHQSPVLLELKLHAGGGGQAHLFQL